MKMRALLLSVAACCALAGAQSVREFHSSAGYACIGLLSSAPGADTSAYSHAFRAALSDPKADIPALLSRFTGPDFLLDLAYADPGGGEELRFPVPCSQARDFLARHPAEYFTGPPEARMVLLVRGLARKLQVRMQKPAGGSGK